MRVSVDLHIHSGLSPCSHRGMTPNNIVNMAYIKGLDIISITDHNSMRNVKVIMELGRKRGILVIPGIEVTTREEIHVLSYFSDLEKGLKFQDMIYEGLIKISNKEETFGEQVIYNVNDEKVSKVECLLINSTKYSIEEVNRLTLKFDGVMVPAHIDRKSFSVISAIGFIPEEMQLNTLEVSSNCDIYSLKKLIGIERYSIIVNSDAHYLGDISEPNFYLYPKRKTGEDIIECLRKGWKEKV